MDRKKSIKIMLVLVLAFFVTSIVSQRLFITNTPRLNTSYIGALPQQAASIVASLFAARATPIPLPPTITPVPPMPIVISSTAMPVAPTKQPQPTVQPTSVPTRNPTKAPTLTPKPQPTTPPATANCPTTSTQTYTTIPQRPSLHKMNFDPATNPETNIALRGYFPVNESKDLISRHGDNTGLDPNMPPQISTLFQNHYPKIVSTYDVNAWDYAAGKPIPGENATPAWKVTLIGLEATPGEPLVGLKAGRTVDGSHVFLVMYATKNMIMLVHADSDNWDDTGPDGYPYYFLDICVDPNLLALYEKDNAGGRNELPGISTGQIFGYAKGNEVKATVRDTMSFMDLRFKEDWWEYGK